MYNLAGNLEDTDGNEVLIAYDVAGFTWNTVKNMKQRNMAPSVQAGLMSNYLNDLGIGNSVVYVTIMSYDPEYSPMAMIFSDENCGGSAAVFSGTNCSTQATPPGAHSPTTSC